MGKEKMMSLVILFKYLWFICIMNTLMPSTMNKLSSLSDFFFLTQFLTHTVTEVNEDLILCNRQEAKKVNITVVHV